MFFIGWSQYNVIENIEYLRVTYIVSYKISDTIKHMMISILRYIMIFLKKYIK